MPPMTDPGRGRVAGRRPDKETLSSTGSYNRSCYSKYAVANRRHHVPASLKISGLAAAVALTAALTSCSTGGGSSSSSSAASSPPASASTLNQQARRDHALAIYANPPGQYFQPPVAALTNKHPFIKQAVTG